MRLSQFDTEHFTFKDYAILSLPESQLIWHGRNRTEVREWMTNANVITWDEHLQYMKTLKTRQDRIYYAVLKDDLIIGSICLNPFNQKEREAELGNYIFPEFFRLGWGYLSAYEFLDFIFEQRVLDKVTAKIFKNNIRNQQLFKKLGFNIEEYDDEYIYFYLCNMLKNSGLCAMRGGGNFLGI